ncbi:MAG: CCA tRNA nucleotidyltransferase [Candidatus Aenigmarchaeota archaeon]|nr:CCA tRNA nucleotidyltransferase [Candidatus Aenigmarchaeota archaeon]
MIMDIRTTVLKKISPLKKDEDRTKKFITDLMHAAKAVTNLDVVVCGSAAKMTWLREDHDIDLFILFPHVTREELEKKGLLYGNKIIRQFRGTPVIKYAEHPYVHARIKGFDVDIVPCYRIKKGEKIKSAVDRSPLHLEYIIEKLNPGLRDDVRLLKRFMKGIGVYGSDAKNLGFSGYLCELLVINYGRFESVLKAVSEWDIPQVIFIELERKINLKEEYPNQPLIIIDPVDEKRNAAAVVSAEKMLRFIGLAKSYLKKPSMGYFFPSGKKALSEPKVNTLRQRGTKFIALEFTKPDLVDDIVYPQVRRLLKRVESLMSSNEFKCLRCCEFIDKKVYLILEMEIWELPPVKKMTGPHIFAKQHVKEFRKKYANAFPEENIWVAEKPREYRTAVELLQNFIKKSGKESGVPKKLASVIKIREILSKF